LWVADRVDEEVAGYRERHGITAPWETKERVAVALTGAEGGERLLRRASRMAARANGELIGVHVRTADGFARAPSEGLESQRRLLGELGGRYRQLRPSRERHPAHPRRQRSKPAFGAVPRLGDQPGRA